MSARSRRCCSIWTKVLSASMVLIASLTMLATCHSPLICTSVPCSSLPTCVPVSCHAAPAALRSHHSTLMFPLFPPFSCPCMTSLAAHPSCSTLSTLLHSSRRGALYIVHAHILPYHTHVISLVHPKLSARTRPGCRRDVDPAQYWKKVNRLR